MARTTVDNTVARCRRRMQASLRPESNIMVSLTTTSGTALVYTYDQAAIRIGAILCIGTELLYVTAVNTGTKTATVVRGWFDSDPATHAAGDEIQVNPIYSTMDVFDALIAEIDSWGPHLYKVLGATVAVADSDDTIELASTFIGTYGLIEVLRNQTIDSSTIWPRLNFRVQRGVGTTWTGLGAPTSGIKLRIIDSMLAGNLYVVAAMPFDTSAITMATDLVSGTGLAVSMLDVLEMGVIIRLLGDGDIPRESRNAIGQPGLASDVPVGSTVQPRQLTRSLYTTRKNQEIMKLRAAYPVRYS